MEVSQERALQMLDGVAEELIARGFDEARDFAVQGRRPRRPLASALTFMGFADGEFSAWYRESADTTVLARSADFDEVRAVFVRAVEAEAAAYRSQFEED